MMMIYPCMEIENLRCVSLRRGRLDEPMVWHVDAVEKAREFAAAGASWMHLTDIDAIRGSDRNRDLVVEIIRQVGIPVQLGGGFRSIELIEQWINLGVGRIVVGTLAVLRPDMIKMAAKLYPDQIVVSVDVWQGNVMTHGWDEPSAITPESLIAEYAGAPLSGILITDIDANVEDKRNSLELLSALAVQSRSPVIASGLIRTLDDISRLKQVPNVVGALVGTALFNRTVDLEEVLAEAQPTPHSAREAN